MDKKDVFVNKAALVHGDKYDYSLVEYTDAHTPVVIICSIHGQFLQRPCAHTTSKQGCPQCGLLNRKLPNQKSNGQFLDQTKAKWGATYDYSITNYVNKETKIKFICKEHGVIEQKPFLHLKTGCQFCNGRGIGKHTKESFIVKAKEIHGDKYDYGKIEFNSMNDKIVIICPNHGEFIQKASNHINIKNGCPKCNGGVKINTDEFIQKAKQRHGDKFDYSLVEYIKASDEIKIICPKHGEFKQAPMYHLQTLHSCPDCIAAVHSSQAEKEIIDFIKEYYDGVIKPNDRTVLGQKEIDIFIPDINLGIEFNGNYWHTQSYVGKNYHFKKTEDAEAKGIKLIQIFEHEWDNKKDIIKSRLLNLLGKSKKIFARKTKLVHLERSYKNNFMERTHLQGMDDSASICLGLIYNEELVACMTFGKPRFNKNYKYELIRYSSELNTTIIGGAGKLFSYFCKNYSGSIISYADRKWSSGDLYKQLGFDFDGKTTPSYFYYNIKTREVASRNQFQKQKLKNMLHYNDELGEYEIMKLNGYDRIWNSGHLRFVKS